MSKLDKECIDEADSFINAIGERQLNLRDLRLQRIENLILTKDQNQTIDFTDNDILKLAYFPKMPNLETILMGNNRVAKIEENIGDFLPNLKHLILTNNAIQELGDLDPLGTLESLESLSLMENPVCSKEYYRLYVLHRCAKLRFLDFERVKEKERKEAMELFSGEEGLALAHNLSSQASKTFDPEESMLAEKKKPAYAAPSKEEQARIRQAIKEAKTLSEIAHLEQQLSGGVIPGMGR